MATDPRPDSPAWRESARFIAPVICYRAFLLFLIYLSIVLVPMQFYRGNTGFVSVTTIGLDEPYRTWDTPFYLQISQQGYKPGGGEASYFPLWPALIYVCAKLTGASALVAGLILSNLLSAGAIILFHRLAMLRSGSDPADAAMLLLLAFPSSFFLSLPYSESLFLFLAVGLFLAIHCDSYRWQWILGVLLTLSRPVGFICIIPLVVNQLIKRQRLRAFIVATGPLSGLFIYFAIMAIFTGNALAGVHSQSLGPGRSSLSRLMHPATFVEHFFMSGIEWHGYLNSALDRTIFAISLLATAAMALRRRFVDLAYCLPLAIVSAMSSQLISYTRYALVLFPMFLIGGTLLATPKRRGWLWLTLAVSFALQIILMIRHTHGFWAG